MAGFRPTLDPGAAARHLDRLIAPRLPPCPTCLKQLDDRFRTYAATCPVPLPAPGLIITPEIRCQCETYLPVTEVARCCNHLYTSALTYPPLLASTPFHNALSWADAFAALPPEFQFSANPARLLGALLADRDLLTRFLFASFLPRRYYGGLDRYPAQREWLRRWFQDRPTVPIRCLDAACGIGEGTYRLLALVQESGLSPEAIRVEGWTIEPLEVWAATHVRLPHDRQREESFRQEVAGVFEQGAERSVVFRTVDLLGSTIQVPSFSKGGLGGISPISGTPLEAGFDLILCNGLLGGPIINRRHGLRQAVANLAALLAPGGVLLAADHFHGGWKKQNPGEFLGALCKECGLKVTAAGEGIAAMQITASWDRGNSGSR